VHGSHTQVSPHLREMVRTECEGRLCVRGNGLPPKNRKFVVATGFGPEHNLGVYNNNISTIERALTERYFLCEEEPGHFRPALKVAPTTFKKLDFLAFHKQILSTMPTNMPRLSRQQVVDRYAGTSKYKLYLAALGSLAQKPLNKNDSRLSTFVKKEKQDVNKAPRVINPRSTRFNLILGTFLKATEKKYFRSINKAFGSHTPHTVIKGLNSARSAEVLLSKWRRFKKPVAVGLDAKKFDLHVTLEALEYEHTFYTSLFPGSKELHDLLRQQLNNRGVAYVEDGMIKFSMRGTRCSGDLNTSLGNCLLMCSMVWCHSRCQGVDIELANNGDDCVVFMEEEDLEQYMCGLPAWFRQKGFAMTVEAPVYEFEQVEFCQTHPVELSSGWRMMRNHRAVLRKDPMCLIDVPTQACYKKWLGAVGECGVKLAGDCPVQGAFYQAFKRNGLAAGKKMTEYIMKNTSMFTNLNGLVVGDEISAKARVSYYYAFGITPDEQIEMERYFKSAVVGPLEYERIPRDALVLEPGIKILD
jgi:hypothetical protein